jgi:hypothetical protein
VVNVTDPYVRNLGFLDRILTVKAIKGNDLVQESELVLKYSYPLGCDTVQSYRSFPVFKKNVALYLRCNVERRNFLYWGSNSGPLIAQPVASHYTDCTIQALRSIQIKKLNSMV